MAAEFEHIGNYNHHKGFSGAEADNGKIITYNVMSIDDSLGKRLLLDTSYSLDGVTFKKGSRFYLSIPYRIRLSDYNFVQNLAPSFSKEQQSGAGDLLFNKGITYSSTDNTLQFNSSIFQDNTIPWAEINFSRKQIEQLQGKDLQIYKTSVKKAYFDNVDIKVYDLQAGIIVRNFDNDYDYVYLTITSEILFTTAIRLENYYIDGRLLRSEKLPISRYIVPQTVILKYKISRSDVILPHNYKEQKPISWAYPYKLEPIEPTKITASTSLWANTFKTFILESANWPIPIGIRGAINDITLDASNNLITFGGFGRFSYSFYHHFSYRSTKITFVDNSFVIGSERIYDDVFDEYIRNNFTPTKLSVSYDTTNDRLGYFISLQSKNLGENSTGSSDSILGITDVSTFETPNHLIKKRIISGKYALIDIEDTTFTIGFYDKLGHRYYIYTLPDPSTLTNSIRSNIGSSGGQLSSLGLNLLGSKSMTINEVLGKTVIISRTIYSKYSKSTIYPNIRDKFRKFATVYYYDIYSNDKTAFSPDKSLRQVYDLNFTKSGPLRYAIETSKVINITNIKEFVYLRDSINKNTNSIVSSNDHLSGNYDYFIGNLNSNNTFLNSVDLIDFNSANINISGDMSGIFWVNPIFDENGIDGITPKGEGIFLQLTMYNCSGFYSNGALTSNSFDRSIGGVPLQSNTAWNFKLAGDYNVFSSSYNSWQGGYWADLINNWKISLKYLGTELINHQGKYPSIWHYDDTGIFHMNLPVFLDTKPGGQELTDALNRKWTNENFALSGIEYDLTLFDVTKNGYTNSTGLIDIEPPSPSGSISTSIYKTINSVTFNMIRDSRSNSNTFTTVKEVNQIRYKRNGDEEIRIKLNPYTDTSTSSDTLVKNIGNLERGGSTQIQYKSRLYDIKGTTPPVKNTNRVYMVKGHRFSLHDVEIYLNSSDVTSRIKNESPYIFIDTDGSVQIDIKYRVEHENWDEYPGASMYNIYPYIKNIYCFAKKAQNYSVVENNPYENITWYSAPPNNVAETYPNHTEAFGQYLKGQYTNASFKDSDSGSSTTVRLDVGDKDLQFNITESNKYQFFLIIEDEFDQYSTFCITNIKNNYNIPFKYKV